MLQISKRVTLAANEVEMHAVRAQGAGGQHVNKVASAIHLRFDIGQSSLPEWYKQRLFGLRDRRIDKAGIVTIKAQRFRTQERNRADALERLAALIRSVSHPTKPRLPSRPTLAAKARRVDRKTARGRIKQLRAKLI